MRRLAAVEKDELQLTLNMIPPDAGGPQPSESATPADKKKKKRFLGRFRGKKEKPTLKDESKDLNLQKAIARSMAEANGMPGDEPVVHHQATDSKPASAVQRQMDDELELAKAISASEAQYAQEQQQQALEPHLLEEGETGWSEEEMFQRALAASRGAPKPPPPSSMQNEEQLLEEAKHSSHNKQPYVTSHAALPAGFAGRNEELTTVSYGEQYDVGGKTDPNERFFMGKTDPNERFMGKTDPNERFLGKTDPNERYENNMGGGKTDPNERFA